MVQPPAPLDREGDRRHVGFVVGHVQRDGVAADLLGDQAGPVLVEVGEPVTGLTGLWYVPGIFLLVGPIIWFVKTNGALNDYWRSQGATG